MSYTINRYNGTQIAVVADGTIDATIDLKLIGKNYAGYGAVQNENFVYLLENFANTTQPPKPLPGQIWYDSGNSKLKFWDGSKFRTTGGAEIGTTAPTGLTIGDFWYDSSNQQLYAYNGASFTLIGPQAVAGSATTQMRSVSLTDIAGGTHAVIEAVDNGNVIFIVSSDSDFTLDATINPITGFSIVHQGVTLCYTNNNSQPGQTTSSHRFYGTATNADRLGGLSASNFVQSTGSPQFTSQVNFGDVGFTVGNPIARLAVFNQGASTPTIANQVNNTIAFQTTVSSTTKYPLQLVGADVLPGVTLTSNLGSSGLQWNNVYANYYYGTSQQADALNVGGNYRTASTSATSNTIAARDASGNLTATIFSGTASAANYADLAEKYLPDAEYAVGTVVAIGGTSEITACQTGDRAIGIISGNPAYMMNSGLEGGVYVALKGRVPCKVTGLVRKGQRLVAGPNGTATAMSGDLGPQDCFAIALSSFGTETEIPTDHSSETGTIEVLVL
jgi:hypothetical protein